MSFNPIMTELPLVEFLWFVPPVVKVSQKKIDIKKKKVQFCQVYNLCSINTICVNQNSFMFLFNTIMIKKVKRKTKIREGKKQKNAPALFHRFWDVSGTQA